MTNRRMGLMPLGDIFQSLAGRGLRFSADMVCSPPFQAAAAQSIAERYGEAQAQQFREHLRAATAFCRGGAIERQEAAREAEKQRTTYWALGLTVAALGGLFLWFQLGKKGNRKRPWRRNGGEGQWRVEIRHKGSASVLSRGRFHSKEEARRYAEDQRKWDKRHGFQSTVSVAKKPSIADLRMRNAGRTFAQARNEIFDYLSSRGWRVVTGLKVPYATSPDGRYRLWFKAQSVQLSDTQGEYGSGKHTLGDARSLWIDDLRKVSPEQFMAYVQRWTAGG